MKYIVFLFSITGLLFFNSCSKFDDLDKQMDASVDMSSLAIFNTVPNSVSMEIYLDEEKVNAVNEKLEFGGYLRYKTQFSGRKKIKIVNYYKDTKEVYEDVIDLDKGKVYSLFVSKEKTLALILKEDDMIKPQPGFAKIRVAHMSSDAVAFAFGEEGKNMLFNSVRYKEVTPFMEVSSSVSRTFLIRPTTTSGNTPQLKQIFVPKDQGIYTLLIKGYVRWNNEAEELDMKLIEH